MGTCCQRQSRRLALAELALREEAIARAHGIMPLAIGVSAIRWRVLGEGRGIDAAAIVKKVKSL